RQNILRLIDKEQPDILGFQEFFTRYKGKYLIKDSIFKILDSKQYYFFPNSGNDYEATGIALFTKLPIVARGTLEDLDPKGANNGVWVDLNKNGKIFRVYVVHLASISFRPEDYSYLNKLKSDFSSKEDVEKGKLILYRLRNAFIRRAKQVDILKNYTDTCKTPYVIMGDFNDTPSSYTVNQISKDMKNAFREKGSGLGITYNGEFPNFQIDYILTSRQFDILSYKIIKEAYSDHYPVKAEVKLNADE
ncbi:endonuclease/exonuclease/phosphatase, partial [Pseudoxanthomonas sp. SGD-10]